MEKKTGRAHEEVAGTEHEGEPHHKVGYGSKAKVHEVLHQDIDRILRSGKTGLQKSKASLHEHHQYGSNKNPDSVQGYPVALNGLGIGGYCRSFPCCQSNRD